MNVASKIENSGTQYFGSQCKIHSAKTVQCIKDFVNDIQSIESFDDKDVLSVHPIYSHRIEDIAYYELTLTEDGVQPNGWLLVSANEHDIPLVNFSLHGVSPTTRLLSEIGEEINLVAKNDNYKVYRYNAGYYALENAEGELVSDFGTRPNKRFYTVNKDDQYSYAEKGIIMEDNSTYILSSSGKNKKPSKEIKFKEIKGYEELKKFYSESDPEKRHVVYDRYKRARYSDVSEFPSAKALPTIPGFDVRYIDGAVGHHTQIDPNSSYNLSTGSSGCCNNAWLNLFCWWDLKGRTTLIPEVPAEGCPTNRLTLDRRDAADPVQIWLANRCGTSASGYTEFWDAHKGALWLDNRGYHRHWWYQWCWPSSGCGDTLNILDSYIWQGRKPVHIGYGNHFAVGVGLMKHHTFSSLTYVEINPGFRLDDSDNFWLYYGDINSVCGVWV